MPLIGYGYSKDNTKQLFGNLYMEDPTFASEKFKRYQRQHAAGSTLGGPQCTKAVTMVDGGRTTIHDILRKRASRADGSDAGVKASTLSRERNSETIRSHQKSEGAHRYERPLHESGVSDRAAHIALKSSLQYSKVRTPSMTLATLASTRNSTRQNARPRTAVKRDHQLNKGFSNEFLMGTVNSTTNKSSLKKAKSKQKSMTNFHHQPDDSRGVALSQDVGRAVRGHVATENNLNNGPDGNSDYKVMATSPPLIDVRVSAQLN